MSNGTATPDGMDLGFMPGVSDVSVMDALSIQRQGEVSSATIGGVDAGSASKLDVPPGDARAMSDQSYAAAVTAPVAWDQMGWLEKAKAYATDIIPGAVKETFGFGTRPGAETVGGTIDKAAKSVTGGFGLGQTLILLVIGLGLLMILSRRA